jgi:eukaryotic-like serine/threonine-protein kinase
MKSTSPNVVAHRYRLVELLGEGGMGTVYRAYDRLTGEYVALKRIIHNAKTLSTNPDLRLGLIREFQMLASLRHPNIIKILDYGLDADDQPYFAMELVDKPQTLLQAGLS